MNNIGNNSVATPSRQGGNQTPHDGVLSPEDLRRLTDNVIAKREESWRRFEAAQLHRERFIRRCNGTIKAPGMMQPQLLVKTTEGKWIPEIKVVGDVSASR